MKRVLAGTAFVAAGTWVLGWWTVPLVGAGMGLLWPDDRPALSAAAAGALGWGILLVWGGLIGPVMGVAGTVGGVMGLPGAAVLLITLLFPAILSGAAGALVGVARARGEA